MSILILFNWSVSGDLLELPQPKYMLHYQVSQVAYRTGNCTGWLGVKHQVPCLLTALCVSGHSLHWWGEKTKKYDFFLSF